ncbi:MAG: Sensor histidine kinase [Deltaproteobacteria bacterium]|nr:Sensor histidine kinase [Deltaproteobacteria bacterium]
MALPDDLRAQIGEISSRWDVVVLEEVPALAALSRAELLDHLPEFLDGLARWIAGDLEPARAGFRRLAERHALQRHSSGISLQALTSEYATLRRVILERLLEISDRDLVAASLIRIGAGMDHAIGEAVRCYSDARDHVRERFIAVLAHDLRDPLSAVMMSATLLSDMTLGARQAQLVERVTRGSRRIERMIDDVLDFARGRSSGGIPVSPVNVDMAAICGEAIDEARALGLVAEIKLELSGDLRGMWDRDRARQALANLLSNARHSGQGVILVRAWERADPPAVLTSVRDHGPVIPPEIIGRIFDPFSRGQGEGRRRGHGHGLGLYIVEQIALAHGGVCRASSTADATEFTIEWPRLPQAEVPGRAPS